MKLSSATQCPLILPFLYPPRCLAVHARGISCSAKRSLPATGVSLPKLKLPPQKSYKVMMQEQLKRGTIPNDMGLLPETFIMPTGSNKPTLMSMLRERLVLEQHRLVTRFKDCISILIYKWTSSKPRPKISFWHKAKAAKALHTQMYLAFAEGDIETLREVCTDGLLNDFSARISHRLPEERLRWYLHRYIRSRVVSHRAVQIPGIDGAGLRQAVVRVESEQSLEKVQDSSLHKHRKVQKKTEYMVIQKRMMDKTEGPWMVWGTIGESDWKTVVF